MNGKFHDTLHFLSKLSLKRIVNSLKIQLGFYLKKNWGLPYSFSIEPTTSCNLRCPECPSGLRSFSRETGHLDLGNFKKYLANYAENAIYLTLYFQGEPFLNPHFLEMVKLAEQKKLYVSTSTNAHYLSPEMAKNTIESGLDRLIVSVDGTSQESYEKYRIGGNLEKVKEGIRNMVFAKKEAKSSKPYLILQFLVMGQNEHEIEKIQKLGSELGVDEVKLKTAQVYDYKNGSPLIPKNEKYARYIADGKGAFKLKYELKNECWRMWHSNVITWDGKVVPCCFDKDAKYIMGDLNTHSLAEIWTNEKYKRFRNQLLTDRNKIDICVNCTEGSKVFSD
jgi:radical SAM protein with 4Fe4S-binding SPASM domain